MTQTNWTCPHCSRPQIATQENQSRVRGFLQLTELVIGDVGVIVDGISCLNPECKKLTLSVSLRRWEHREHGSSYYRLTSEIDNWRLVPESSAIPQPEYIPAPLVADYQEACRIRDLSPKASATLSRRCLQGMIRDFCKIAKGTLDAEIKAVKLAVDEGKAPAGVTHESVEAIDHVRSIGNIGAHMEKDINLIIDVEAGEAQALIGLIEMLFEEWYVARHSRQQKLAKIAAIAADKKSKLADGKSQRSGE